MTSVDSYGVKYIGSKASLLTHILAFVEARLPPGAPRTLIDCFTGTTRVAQAFRSRGWTVQTSDLSWASEAYAHAALARTAASGARVPALLAELRELPGTDGWITANYCDVSGAEGGIVRMWSKANGRRGDAIRGRIAEWEAAGAVTHHEAMILVACLLFALDKVDSSVGVQQAYLKNYATRALNPLDLVDLPVVSGPVGTHVVGDALKVEYAPATVAYLDPPYSPHSYATYYHIWDSITRWDKPAVGLKTNRRIDRVSGAEGFDAAMVSPWNSKRGALAAFMALVERLPVTAVCISYNDESIVPLEGAGGLVESLKGRWGDGCVEVMKIPYQRNIMAQIGNAAAEGGKAARGEAKTENHEVLIWVRKGGGGVGGA